MNDLIDRQMVIEALRNITVTGKRNAELVMMVSKEFADRIGAMPSVELTCDGCKYYNDQYYVRHCQGCKRRLAVDNWTAEDEE